ncbi:uncharacterized protein LOC131802237 [Musca domestica]|uniref:Uncharacterized protein LOC131802237 n=1 Tax=Musca domestica TaxID=7370 RepID=A0ABM3UWX7_MUSDO|nr:uncharacterized protein LOC131802237 [Musca domestica]
MSSKMNENIWRLVKLSFESSIDNVPHEAYRLMGYALTAIPLEDFRNISMENVDMIEIFGSIINTMSLREYQQGFSEEQLSMLAQKVRSEWLGKTPQTYSEYDLRAMGEILCYFNVTDIENIHTDAFMEAIEWIGLLEKCPEDRLQAFANMARRSDAFGEPNKWSKLEVTIIGNILNGLPTQDINAISKDKLQLNHFYRPHGGIQQQQQQHQRGSDRNFTLKLNETTKSGEENLGVKNNSN